MTDRKGFSWVTLWTVVGALVPGTGLVAAGRRRLGFAVLGLLGCGAGLIGLASAGTCSPKPWTWPSTRRSCWS